MQNLKQHPDEWCPIPGLSISLPALYIPASANSFIAKTGLLSDGRTE